VRIEASQRLLIAEAEQPQDYSQFNQGEAIHIDSVGRVETDTSNLHGGPSGDISIHGVLNASHRLLAETVQQYIDRLKELGIKSLGDGSFAEVFQHPTMPNVVVKLLYEDDPGYLKYLKFCQGKGKGNPYCPKILQVVQAKDAFDITTRIGENLPNLHLVFMEKLKPINNTQYASFVALLHKSSGMRLSPEDRELWFHLSRQIIDKDLAVVARFIYATSAKEDLDMHTGNVMKRGTQWVITDPFSS
jgi:hypothetical protein